MFDRIFLVLREFESEERKIELQSDESFDDHLSGRLVDVSTLMLLGILYCRSNRRQRAEKFFELLDPEKDGFMKDNDKDF